MCSFHENIMLRKTTLFEAMKIKVQTINLYSLRGISILFKELGL